MADSSPPPVGSSPPGPADRLVVELQSELRAIAAVKLAGEPAGHTLQPTAIVNEAYLRLVRQRNLDGADRARFLAAAAQTMQRILIDHARAKGAAKRGGDALKLSLDGLELVGASSAVDAAGVADILEKLAGEDRRTHEIVVLRYFGGLTIGEVAAALGISPRTVADDWSFARAWLRRELNDYLSNP